MDIKKYSLLLVLIVAGAGAYYLNIGYSHTEMVQRGFVKTDNLPHPDEMLRLQEINLTEEEIAFIEAVKPKLFGGRPIKQNELRPSMNIGNCTGTVIGPQAFLTAAHCRDTGSTISFTYERKRYTGRCEQHPQYSQGRWLNNDWALCKFSPAIELPVWGSLEPVQLKKGDKVTMQGYGRGSNGVLNVGTSAIVRIDSMDYITQDSVYLGGGDSGGALFDLVPDLVNGPFKVVGVNSRGSRGGVSYFNIAALERSQKFFKDWAKRNNVKVCGVNWECGSVDPDACPVEKDIVKQLEFDLEESKKVLNSCLQE